MVVLWKVMVGFSESGGCACCSLNFYLRDPGLDMHKTVLL
jgi:hypothetical protein